MITLANELISHPWAFWMIAAMVSGLLEIALPSFGVVFASLGALCAALVSVWLGWTAQLLCFSAVLALSVLLIRPRVLKYLHKTAAIPSRAQALVGLVGETTEAIDPIKGSGRISVQGEDWAARSSQDSKSIAVGKKVTVESSDGIVLVVKEN